MIYYIRLYAAPEPTSSGAVCFRPVSNHCHYHENTKILPALRPSRRASRTPGYAFQCHACDEDFYRFEVLNTRRISLVRELRRIER